MSQLTRRLFTRFAVLAGAASLAGCKAPTAPLRIGSIVFPGYEPLFLARDLGWLSHEKVRLFELRSNHDALRALASQQLDAAQLTLDELLTGISEGLDLRVVAVLDRSEGADAVVAHPRVPAGASLVGRSIAYESGAVGALMLASFLRAFDLRPDQVKHVPTTLMTSASTLRRGEADLVVTAEPWLTELVNDFGARRLFDSKALPWRIVNVMAVRADALQSHAECIHHAVQMHYSALGFWLRRPQEGARRVAPRLGLRPDAVQATLRGLVQPDQETAAKWLSPGSPLALEVDRLQQTMLADGLLTRMMPTDALFDPRFLR